MHAVSERFVSIVAANYQAADQKGKAAIRADLTKGQQAAVRSLDLVRASAYQAAIDGLASAKATPKKAEVDVHQVIADRIASLRLAADLLEAGVTAPEGMEPIAYPEARGVASVDVAFSLAGQRVTKSAKAFSVQEVIDKAFAEVEVGTFLKVSEICNKADYPHPGAVAARLFSAKGCTLVGVEPVEATATTAKGARKVA